MRNKNKLISRILYFLCPLIVMIAGNAVIYSVFSTSISNRQAKAAIGALFGLILFALLIRLTTVLARRALIPASKMGDLRGLAFGLFIGLIVSCSSALLFSKTSNLGLNWGNFKEQLPLSALFSVAPATVEETVFRFGIVHGTAVLINPTVGLMAGSIPFGFGHFLNKFAGQSVTFEQVLGITIAGLLLSLLYLKYGLSAAIGCHYMWNSLAGPWIKAMGLNGSQGISSFEGAWTTSLVIGVTISILILHRRFKSNPK